jgi:beta-galactosidase
VTTSFGVAYYPEHVDLSRVTTDLERIRTLGLSSIRIGDFAWSSIEPAPGEFCWDVFDATFDAAARCGVEVVLCTPTAAPPAWLTKTNPDVLPVDVYGRRATHGARQHRCFQSSAYRKACDRVVHALAKRYSNVTTLAGWQIDNELGGEHKRCYCEYCENAFGNFLKSRYSDIHELNERWGTRFWSQTYTDWSDIPIPRRIHLDMMLKHHPSLVLEYARFSSEAIVSFARSQAEIIRNYQTPSSSPAPSPGLSPSHAPSLSPLAREVFITTNTDSFYWGDSVDIAQLFENLDVSSIDLYSDDVETLRFYGSVMRGIKGQPFLVTELGVSVPNIKHNVQTLAEEGCKAFWYFKYRPFPWGQEQTRTAIRTVCDNPAPVSKKITDLAASAISTIIPASEVALLYDFESSWVYEESSWSDNWEERTAYPRYIEKTVFPAIRNEAGAVDIVFGADAISSYRVVLAPLLILHRPRLESGLAGFLENGGVIISTIDFLSKNKDNVFHTRPPEIYRQAFGPDCIDFFYEFIELPIGSTHGSGTLLLMSTAATSQDWVDAYRSIAKTAP